MHTEAMAWVAKMTQRHGPFRSVLELGGRNINGSVRCLFPGARYLSLDIVDGPGVDVVADAAAWRSETRYDAVVCCEVLEHVPDPAAFVKTAWDQLEHGGRLFATMATDPRAPHSASDGAALRPGEHYANVDPLDMLGWLSGWDRVDVEVHRRGDLYVTAVRP